MTLLEVLNWSGISYTGKDTMHLGMIISDYARNNGVLISKKDQTENGEIISVNDYPEKFSKKMQKIIIEYFTSKVHG